MKRELCGARKKNFSATQHVCSRKKGHSGRHRCVKLGLGGRGEVNPCGFEWEKEKSFPPKRKMVRITCLEL